MLVPQNYCHSLPFIYVSYGEVSLPLTISDFSAQIENMKITFLLNSLTIAHYSTARCANAHDRDL